MRQDYVLGFLFDHELSRVALIRKERPQWQAGSLNGIGGKIDGPFETPHDAMIREFREETTVLEESWKLFGQLRSPDYTVYMFAARSSKDMWMLRSPTDETVGVFFVSDIHTLTTLPNVKWQVPMAKEFLLNGGPRDNMGHLLHAIVEYS